MNPVLTHKSACRICRSRNLAKAFSFGPTPLANSFLDRKFLHEPEQYFPLDAYLCRRCGLLQLLDVVSPEVLFKEYVYVSSTSSVFVAHFRDFAEVAFKRFVLTRDSFIIDIGSNDGILLRPFRERGARVLGIEPDRSIALRASRSGVDTHVGFFTPQLANELARRHGRADLVTATNVFAHIDDIHSVARGVKCLLKKGGVFMIEVPYLVDFLEQNLFDTVYHEHLSYFSVSALAEFFKRVGMWIVDVEKVPTHGGSLRVFVKNQRARSAAGNAVRSLLVAEKKLGLQREETYRAYALRVQKNRAKLLTLLTSLKEKGKRIAGYGAPAKGNTLLNYFSIGSDLLDYIVDDSPYKQGKHTPGKRIPVVPPERLRADPPDYLLILAWNFAEPLMKKNEAFRAKGGKFIIPVPSPRIVS